MKTLFLAIVMSFGALTVQAEQCTAKTKTGQQCKRSAIEKKEYCKQHDPSTIRCAGKAKTGKNCQLIPKKGETFCHLHKSK